MSYFSHQSRSWSLAEMPDEIELRSMSATKTLTNLDMEEPELSFQLDSTWPSCIPNDATPIMKFNIESGIEIPPHNNRNGLAQELLEAMSVIEVGQSFFVSMDLHKQLQIRSAFDSAKKQIRSKQFVSRKAFLPPSGIRIWRVE